MEVARKVTAGVFALDGRPPGPSAGTPSTEKNTKAAGDSMNWVLYIGSESSLPRTGIHVASNHCLRSDRPMVQSA